MPVEDTADSTETGTPREYFPQLEPSPNAILVADAIREAAVVLGAAILATDATASQRIQGMMKLLRNLAAPRPKE